MPLIIGTIRDRRLLRDVLRMHAVHGVMHIAAKKQVGESVTNPLLYYRENVEGLIAVLDVCQSEGVQHFVFSSSAATYGMPNVDLVTENTPVRTADSLQREQTHRRVVGDPARVVASAEKIRTELGFQAVHDLGATIESAWAAWPRRH